MKLTYSDKIVRTIIPLFIGSMMYILCNEIFQYFFPLKSTDESSTPGFVFLIEYILILLFAIILICIQYFVIIPRTKNVIKKTLIKIGVIGILIGLSFGFGHFYIDNATIKESIISCFRIMIQFESFYMSNVLIIGLLNIFKDKTTRHNKLEIKHGSVCSS